MWRLQFTLCPASWPQIQQTGWSDVGPTWPTGISIDAGTLLEMQSWLKQTWTPNWPQAGLQTDLMCKMPCWPMLTHADPCSPLLRKSYLTMLTKCVWYLLIYVGKMFSLGGFIIGEMLVRCWYDVGPWWLRLWFPPGEIVVYSIKLN